jgi:hypothetical protein
MELLRREVNIIWLGANRLKQVQIVLVVGHGGLEGNTVSSTACPFARHDCCQPNIFGLQLPLGTRKRKQLRFEVTFKLEVQFQGDKL